ncbi:hypothetical protein TUM20985_50060 [Mycobacterium antarcticum]|nr:hypothetical protein TUM20985_50060 [Mycolicibacterium sp. TUM20985]GLP81937.1 hypothetical protein TUM20984_33570 [Mycolicibacterium sp. TUM20984]
MVGASLKNVRCTSRRTQASTANSPTDCTGAAGAVVIDGPKPTHANKPDTTRDTTFDTTPSGFTGAAGSSCATVTAAGAAKAGAGEAGAAPVRADDRITTG